MLKSNAVLVLLVVLVMFAEYWQHLPGNDCVQKITDPKTGEVFHTRTVKSWDSEIEFIAEVTGKIEHVKNPVLERVCR